MTYGCAVWQQFRLSSTAVKQAVKVDVTSFNTAFSSAKAVGFSAGPRTGIPTSGTIGEQGCIFVGCCLCECRIGHLSKGVLTLDALMNSRHGICDLCTQ